MPRCRPKYRVFWPKSTFQTDYTILFLCRRTWSSSALPIRVAAVLMIASTVGARNNDTRPTPTTTTTKNTQNPTTHRKRTEPTIRRPPHKTTHTWTIIKPIIIRPIRLSTSSITSIISSSSNRRIRTPWACTRTIPGDTIEIMIQTFEFHAERETLHGRQPLRL